MADLVWIAALSFLPKGIGGVFVDFSGYNRKCSEFVCIVNVEFEKNAYAFYLFLLIL